MAQLDLGEIREIVSRIWTLHQQELLEFNRINDFTHGRLGFPSLPEAADQEVKDIAAMSIKNVLALVRDSFAQNLSVVGYRNADSQNDLPAWKNWQRNRMDARQGEIYRPALTYGVSYVCVTPGKDGPVFKPRSPRKLIATYVDPQVDQWPQYALETWVDSTDGRPTRKGNFYDDVFTYPLNLGPVLPAVATSDDNRMTNVFPAVIIDEDSTPVAHRAGVCPVVRYINDRDADDMIVGEVEPLITLQKAINEVNFDRLVVARFGAFPQKVIAGWSGTKSEVLQASARRVWAFEDPDVKASVLQAASLDQYNGLLQEMMEHLAMVAQISPSQVTGKMINVSADALAAAEANQQRKLSSKRDSLGESHEQLLQLAARMSGDAVAATDDQAEVQWRDTEARSFAAVVDGVVKLATAGVPIQYLLHIIPGMTQQQIVAITDHLESAQQAAQVTDLVASLRGAASGPQAAAGAPARQPGIPGRQPAAPPMVA